MGKGRSFEIVEYRKLIMQQIVESEELRRLLDEDNSTHPEESIPFNKAYPHEYVPETIKETDKFIEKYQKQGYYVITYDLTKNIDTKRIIDLSKEILKEKLEKIKLKGITKSSIRALVVGIPNVGKSTLINKLVGKKIAVVGNKPGVTKNLNWIRVDKQVELLDSPGILWPKLEQEKEAFNLASTTAIKEDILPKEEIAIYIIKFLDKYYPNILASNYGITDISDFYEVYELIGKSRGFISKGGIVDDDRVTNLIINDIKQGKIKGITFDRVSDYEL